jgi:hypothetical protein
MRTIKLGIILLSGILVFSACKKEEKKEPKAVRETKDERAFLSENTSAFYGILDNEYLDWILGADLHVFGINDNANGLCDPTYSDPNRIASSGLKAYNGNVEYLIYTPKYNMTYEKDFDNIFSVGRKDLGDIQKSFHLYIKRDNIEFRTNANRLQDNVLEILKTKVYQHTPNIKIVTVWFKLKASLSICNCEKTDSYLTNGYIIASFAYVHK